MAGSADIDDIIPAVVIHPLLMHTCTETDRCFCHAYEEYWPYDVARYL